MRTLCLLALAWAVSCETVVCLGDSLTAGFGLEEAQAWPAQLAARLQEAGSAHTVINAGVSGDTTSGGLQRLRFVLRNKPDIVIIALGANDGLRGQEIPTIEANLRTLIERVHAADAKVILAGMQLPTNYGADYRDAFAAIYPRIAKDMNVPLIPFLLVGVGGEPSLNLADGVHPNADGHQRIAATVHQALQTVIKP